MKIEFIRDNSKLGFFLKLSTENPVEDILLGQLERIKNEDGEISFDWEPAQIRPDGIFTLIFSEKDKEDG